MTRPHSPVGTANFPAQSVSPPAILFEGVSKKFCRSLSSAAWYGLQDFAAGLIRHPLPPLRSDEFWALHEVSFAAQFGECVGIIGPNGAGKSTLLKLVARESRPDCGRVLTQGRVKSLIRLGNGLQPMLTGRENIYVKGAELGLDKRQTDALLDGIVSFAGLEKALDRPVKHYSDGMYARLEFSIATAVPLDILLIDEVLAVGDIAFQMRCLERLEQLKRQGTAILFVSHSEMNVRQIADRCLLLFDGESLAFGEPDPLFLHYYQAAGFNNRALKPLGGAPDCPEDFTGTAAIQVLTGLEAKAHTGQPLGFTLDYAATTAQAAELVLEFWNSADLLMASTTAAVDLAANGGRLQVDLPFLGLVPGVYRVAGGFRREGRWLGYRANLLRLVVVGTAEYRGLSILPAKITL